MQVKRMAYIINYNGNKVPQKLAEMDVNCAYVSKKFSYAVVYCDANKGASQLLNNLRNVKGFKSVTESILFDKTLNY